MRRCTREGVDWPRDHVVLLINDRAHRDEAYQSVRAIYGEAARRVDLRTLCRCALLGEVLTLRPEVPTTSSATLAWVPSSGCRRCTGTGYRAPRPYPPTPAGLAAWLARGSLSAGEYGMVLLHARRAREQALIASWRDGDDLDERLEEVVYAMDGAA